MEYNKPACVYAVIPCFNEEQVLPETSRRLKEKFNMLQNRGLISYNSKICFVNDGSSDSTWNIICNLHKWDSIFSGINLSINSGHQNALLAGMMTVYKFADAIISLDADLQDDINAIDEMINKYLEGCDIVYGVRSQRNTDTFFKRITAEGFYQIMYRMGGKIVYNHADYRLMSKRAVCTLGRYKEVNLFLRGIIPLIGFKSDIVYYKRRERFAGESKYPVKKMIFFAIEGVTSFSETPIRAITFLGMSIFFVSIIMFVWSIIAHIFYDAVPGWASLMVSLWAMGGLILFSLGIVGEYIGKIYLETKSRPRYIVEEFLDEKNGFILK